VGATYKTENGVVLVDRNGASVAVIASWVVHTASAFSTRSTMSLKSVISAITASAKG